MKTFALIASFFLISAVGAAQCGVVVEPGYVEPPSSANIRLMTFVDGKAVAGARVAIYSVSGGSRRLVDSIATDTNGMAAPQTLSPGDYVVHAWAIVQGWFSDAEFPLHVIPDGRKDVVTSQVYLTPPSTIQRALEALALAAPDKATLGKPRKDFAGVLQDPGAGAIAGTPIPVWKVEGQNQDLVAQVKTANDGTFRVPLADGTYVAIFNPQGFRTKAVVFEISSDESLVSDRESLVVTLRVGGCP